MSDVRTIRVFIASPGDLAVERAAFQQVLEELNAGFGDALDIKFEPLGWEDTLASTGRRSQEVINREIDRCDVFILACTAGGGRRLRTLSRTRRTRKKSFTARSPVGRRSGEGNRRPRRSLVGWVEHRDPPPPETMWWVSMLDPPYVYSRSEFFPTELIDELHFRWHSCSTTELISRQCRTELGCTLLNKTDRPITEASPGAINTMHWAPIPIAEFDLPPSPVGFDLTNEDVFRLLSRASRRGFWLSAVTFIVLLAIGIVAIGIGYLLGGVSCFALAVGAGTGNLLIRHKMNAAIWISREPAAVYWAAPRQWVRTSEFVLTLHTPAAVQLETVLTQDELIGLLHWLRQRNPDALIGSYSPSDSDGRLSGNDPWSPQTPSGASANPTHAP